jgi:hypothetical protein
MAEQTLVDYIKANHHTGFSEHEIRDQLRQAGWDEWAIEEAFAEARGNATAPHNIDSGQSSKNFFGRHGKTIIIILIILVLLPLLGYSGYLLLNKSNQPPTNQSASQTQSKAATSTQSAMGQVQKTAADAASSRDLARLSDVQKLQTALAIYYQKNKQYPKNLGDLVNAGTLTATPTDPKTNESYVYAPLGNPPSFYSISFLLETDVGTLKSGLQVVSSEAPLQSDAIRRQQELVKGAITTARTDVLKITDLSKLPFYPKEEVTVDISSSAGIGLTSARLLVNNLDLLDKTQPYEFRFTAPIQPGQYEVKIFGFDINGGGYAASTTLTVIAPR